MDTTHNRMDTEATVLGEARPTVSPTQSTFKPTATSVPPVIPPDRPGRTLVLCFDGTGDQFDQDNSNIVEFFKILKKDDRARQMVYYQAGIGTYTSPKVATPMASKISKSLDEAIAWNLDAHVMDGYEFLMQNYDEGDRICIFGFSRGAYTARSLAGMIHKVGVLPACNHQQVPFAYKMFTKTDELGWKQSNAFKKAFSIDVKIEFIGVWDTVNSVGLIPRTLPFTTSNTIVRTFRHAVALDERRAKFKANLWNRPNKKEEQLGLKPEEPPRPKKHASTSGHKFQREHERMFSMNGVHQDAQTDIEEVWFSGCHCDVGGGSVTDDTPYTLARIPLRWMIRECFKTKSGIMFNSEGIRKLGIDPGCLWPEVLPRPPALAAAGARIENIPKPVKGAGDCDHPDPLAVQTPPPRSTEEELDLRDALAPIYDQLSLKWFWWILELWPVRLKYQRGDNTWVSYLGWNLGRGRFIPKQKAHGVKVHRSVKTRMEATHENGQPYVPKAAFSLEHTIWVD